MLLLTDKQWDGIKENMKSFCLFWRDAYVQERRKKCSPEKWHVEQCLCSVCNDTFVIPVLLLSVHNTLLLLMRQYAYWA